MSQRLLKALGETVVLILVLTLGASVLVTAPASAREADPRPEPPPGPLVVHAKSSKPDHFTSKAILEMAAGGTGSVVSPTLPKDMTKAKVTVSTDLSDQPGFESMALALLREPTPGKRLMACIGMARASLSYTAWSAAMQDDLDAFYAVADLLFNARLTYCMQVSMLIATVQAEMAGAKLATNPCGQVPLGIKEKVTKSGGSYSLTKDGPATVKSKNAGLKVKCTMISATKTVMTLKPKKKGSTLRKALHSNNLAVALGSASSAASGARVTVAFSS